ncbi:MAG: hypothetical protein ABI083_00295 [Lapillicoccus sp.]
MLPVAVLTTFCAATPVAYAGPWSPGAATCQATPMPPDPFVFVTPQTTVKIPLVTDCTHFVIVAEVFRPTKTADQSEFLRWDDRHLTATLTLADTEIQTAHRISLVGGSSHAGADGLTRVRFPNDRVTFRVKNGTRSFIQGSRSGSKVTLSGTVKLYVPGVGFAPSTGGRRVVLERLAGASWQPVTTVVTASDGRVTATVTAGLPRSYRWNVLSGGGGAASTTVSPVEI